MLADRKPSFEFYIYAWTLDDMKSFARDISPEMEAETVEECDSTGVVRAFEKGFGHHLVSFKDQLITISSEMLKQVDLLSFVQQQGVTTPISSSTTLNQMASTQ